MKYLHLIYFVIFFSSRLNYNFLDFQFLAEMAARTIVKHYGAYGVRIETDYSSAHATFVT